MGESLCEILLDYFPRISEVEELHSTTTAYCVLNSFLSYTAIMLNVVTIHAIRKTSSLPKTLKTLILSLAVSDVGVGLLVQPFYISLLVMWSQQNILDCNTYEAWYITASSFSLASFLGVVALSVDRFLAIHLHLRYQELVTHKRVVAVVILIWVMSAFIPFLVFLVPRNGYSFLLIIIEVVGLILATMVYIRIYLAVRRHKNQIQFLQVRQVVQAGELANFASFMKSAVGIFYVYLAFLVCYSPYFVSLGATRMNGPSIVSKRFFLFSFSLVFLNSSLNPVIYCWKMRHIRHAIINILRNMFRHRSLASHEAIELTGVTMT